MPVFFYKARDERGQMVQGSHEAISEAAVVIALQDRGLLVTKVEYSAAELLKLRRRRKIKRHKKIRTRDVLAFVSDAATLLDAGIPLIRAIELVADQIESEQLHKILVVVRYDLNAGSTLKDAIVKHPKVFPSLWGHLIEAGEISGTLPYVLKQLGEHLEASENLRSKVVSALIYPCVLGVIAIGVILIFLLKIVPVFSKMFTSFGAQLPLMTRLIIGLSEFMQTYFILIAAGIAALVIATRNYVSTPAGRRLVDRLALDMPLFGGFIQDAIIARIAINLSTLVKSGIDILKSVDIAARASGNALYETALTNVCMEVQQGRVMSASMADNPLFTPMMVRMIMIGEESGRLVDMLENVSKYYQNRVETFVARLSVLIEPIILVFMGLVVGFLVTAIFLPIFSVSSLIK
jgi:type IV pilus assembly protein PilC